MFIKPISYLSYQHPNGEMKIERWKDVPSHLGLYICSDLGRLQSKYKILHPERMKLGYERFAFSKNGIKKRILVHVVVSSLYIETVSLSKLEVNHKNGIKWDNKYFNLEKITKSENVLHSYRVLNRKKSMPKVPIAVSVFKDGIHIGVFYNQTEASKKLLISKSNISEAVKNKRLTKGYRIITLTPDPNEQTTLIN